MNKLGKISTSALILTMPAVVACSEVPYDTTEAASKRCPKDQPDQCIALFGDPTTAGIKESDEAGGPTITAFTPKAYYGDAPFKTTLQFEVANASSDSFTCKFDAEGDGIFEQEVDCSEGSVSVVYPIPGRYAPAIEVKDSLGRTASASEILLSNRVVLKPETIVVDELPGLEQTNVENDVVTLNFATEGQVPTLKEGAILLDRTINGFIRKVNSAAVFGAQVVAQTEKVAIYDAFESGYFGLRYAPAQDLSQAQKSSFPKPESQGSSEKPTNEPSSKNISVPMLTKYNLEVAGVDLAIENPKLDLNVDLVLFETSIAGRYVFILSNNRVQFESDASLTGTIDLLKDKSIFLPLSPVSGGWSTPFGKAAVGPVVEIGVEADLSLSVGWHQRVDTKFTVNVRQTDPLLPDWAKAMLGYPPDVAEVTGPTPIYEASNGKVGVELAGKVFFAPEVIISVGNASGVMQRAKKDAAIYKKKCEEFVGIRAAAGLEANVSMTGKLEVTANDASLCLDLKDDVKLFAELFPGFDFCPSVEYSFLSDAQKDLWHGCLSAPLSCLNNAQDAGETDIDCGGSCPSCGNGKKCSTNADCQSGSCQGGICATSSSTCPSGNGYYCGKTQLGQNSSYLYYCQNGSYSLSDTCSGQGCQVNAPGFDDSCASSCQCSPGTCCSNGCNYDGYGTGCGTCKICDGSGGCINVSNGTGCPGGTCQSGVCTSSCQCSPGTCCSNGCNYDGYGTGCGTCKICDGSGGCINASNGSACSGGTCQNGQCMSSCSYQSFTKSPDYTCGGGIVMNIQGNLDASGNLTVSATKNDGSNFGTGDYYVLVFDANDGVPSNHCKDFNVPKGHLLVTSSNQSTLSFPTFPSLLMCGGPTKGYCVSKASANDKAWWGSNEFVASYQ